MHVTKYSPIFREWILSRQPKSAVLKRFQWRYTGYFMFSVALSILLAGGTAFFFLKQNYDIFTRIALDHAPDLLINLEREKDWVNNVLVSVVAGLFAFFLFVGYRMTSSLFGPILVLQNHLRALIRGNLSQRPIRVRHSDEFQDLIDTYNYAYRTLQTQAKEDLGRLKQISVNIKDNQTRLIIEAMMTEKSAQLNEISVLIEPEIDSRRAS